MKICVRSTDAPSYKFFYEVKGKMSVGRRPSLFSKLSNPKIEYNSEETKEGVHF